MTAALMLLALAAPGYFPPPDAEGGWRTRTTNKFDEVFRFTQGSAKNGGLLVAHKGWLIYERYYGRGSRDATPNTASCGKSFTSIATGILIGENPERFPQGLDQKVFAPGYLPPEAFPLADPRRAEIRLGQLLAMTGGIRGNNPGSVRGRAVMLDPAGPDGFEAMVEDIALGKMKTGGQLHTQTLWCEPGEGYSYATSSIHLASMVVRQVSGMELEEFIATRVAGPLGWGKWGWGYRRPEITHTPGGGGIAIRATDMLRFAYLLLREGRWGDRQVVPAEYVRHCGRASRFNPHSPVSLAFDVNTDGHVAGVPRDAFWKSGSGGHCFYIIPSLDLVIYKLGGRDNQYDPESRGAENFKATVDPQRAVVETLQRTVAALRGR